MAMAQEGGFNPAEGYEVIGERESKGRAPRKKSLGEVADRYGAEERMGEDTIPGRERLGGPFGEVEERKYGGQQQGPEKIMFDKEKITVEEAEEMRAQYLEAIKNLEQKIDGMRMTGESQYKLDEKMMRGLTKDLQRATERVAKVFHPEAYRDRFDPASLKDPQKLREINEMLTAEKGRAKIEEVMAELVPRKFEEMRRRAEGIQKFKDEKGRLEGILETIDSAIKSNRSIDAVEFELKEVAVRDPELGEWLGEQIENAEEKRGGLLALVDKKMGSIFQRIKKGYDSLKKVSASSESKAETKGPTPEISDIGSAESLAHELDQEAERRGMQETGAEEKISNEEKVSFEEELKKISFNDLEEELKGEMGVLEKDLEAKEERLNEWQFTEKGEPLGRSKYEALRGEIFKIKERIRRLPEERKIARVEKTYERAEELEKKVDFLKENLKEKENRLAGWRFVGTGKREPLGRSKYEALKGSLPATRKELEAKKNQLEVANEELAPLRDLLILKSETDLKEKENRLAGWRFTGKGEPIGKTQYEALKREIGTTQEKIEKLNKDKEREKIASAERLKKKLSYSETDLKKKENRLAGWRFTGKGEPIGKTQYEALKREIQIMQDGLGVKREQSERIEEDEREVPVEIEDKKIGGDLAPVVEKEGIRKVIKAAIQEPSVVVDPELMREATEIENKEKIRELREKFELGRKKEIKGEETEEVRNAKKVLGGLAGRREKEIADAGAVLEDVGKKKEILKQRVELKQRIEEADRNIRVLDEGIKRFELEREGISKKDNESWPKNRVQLNTEIEQRTKEKEAWVKESIILKDELSMLRRREEINKSHGTYLKLKEHSKENGGRLPPGETLENYLSFSSDDYKKTREAFQRLEGQKESLEREIEELKGTKKGLGLFSSARRQASREIGALTQKRAEIEKTGKELSVKWGAMVKEYEEKFGEKKRVMVGGRFVEV